MNPVVTSRRTTFEETLLSARRTMLLSEILKLAVDSFRAAKTRFFLTALGMVIGTASVILVVTIGMTGKAYILDLIQKFGTNSVEVEYAGGGATALERVRYTDYLTREDEKAVVDQLPNVMYSSPVMDMHDRISFGGGVVKDDTDDITHQKCAVVSEEFAKERYGGTYSAVGRTFEISGIPFTVIGVFKMSVNDFGQSEIADQTILIPYSVVRYFTGTERVNQIYFSMRSMSQVPDAQNDILRIIKSRHRINSVYKAQTLTELLDIANKSADALTMVLVLVACVTLAVGGVGIMNIMLANVRSRIREIGIRKALGATFREIKLQFLAEAVIISLTGGIVGTLVGISVPLSIRLFTDYKIPISPWSVIIALASAVGVGVVFGTVPATRAAQMDPVEALKYE
jgi:putative ABC transport system permease protein